MTSISTPAGSDFADYTTLQMELRGLLHGERDWLANLANASALLYMRLPQLNWVGFYLWRGGELVLGPFQGKPACIRIQRGNSIWDGSVWGRLARLEVALT